MLRIFYQLPLPLVIRCGAGLVPAMTYLPGNSLSLQELQLRGIAACYGSWSVRITCLRRADVACVSLSLLGLASSCDPP